MYKVIEATEDNIKKINNSLEKSGAMEVLLSNEHGDLRDLAKELYLKHSEYLDHVYGRLTGDIIIKDVLFGKTDRKYCIRGAVKHNILNVSEPIVIDNSCQDIEFKYYENSGKMSFKLAVLINCILHPELLSFEDVVEFLSLENAVLYNEISMKLELIWKNQVKVDSPEFSELVKNNTPEEISEIKEIVHYMYEMLTDKRIEYIYKDYELRNERDFSLIKDGVLEINKAHGKRSISASFPKNIKNYVLGNRGHIANAGYIQYDGYLIEIPLYKFMMANAQNKKIYIPVEDFMDGMWNCIVDSVNKEKQ